MKLIFASVLVAIAMNSLIDHVYSRTAIARDGDCSPADTSCPTTDCCGTATPVSGSTTKKVCNEANSTLWVDVNAANAQYYFACDPKDKAIYLVCGLTVMAANFATFTF